MFPCTDFHLLSSSRWIITLFFSVWFAEIGMGLTGFGVFFLFFGMILFFDKALLAIGNVSFAVSVSRSYRKQHTKQNQHRVNICSVFRGTVLPGSSCSISET